MPPETETAAAPAPEPTAPAPRRGAFWTWIESNPGAWVRTVAGGALLLRLIYIFQLSRTPFYYPDRLDPLFYFDWARAIAAGDWLGKTIFVQSPLYAYFVALFIKVLGETRVFPVLQIVQALMGVGTCLLTIRLARRLLGEREAFVAGVLTALYGPFLFYDGMVMKTFLSTFLTMLLLDLLYRSAGRIPKWLLLSGVVFALTALVRDNFVLLYPLLLGGLLFAFRGVTGRDRLKAAALFTAGAALVILPVTARNYVVGREFALLTTGGGEVFYIGNNPDANGRYLPPPFVHADPAKEHDDFIAKASELSGHPLTPGQSSSFWLRQGLAWIGANPGAWLKLTGQKLLVFWNHYELPDNYNYYELRQVLLEPLTVSGAILYAPLTFLTFGLIAPLGLVGIVLTARRWRDLVPVYLVLFGYMGSVLLFFNFSRFRVPIVPLLCLMASATLVPLFDEIRRWVDYFAARPGGEAAEAGSPEGSAAGERPEAAAIAGGDPRSPVPATKEPDSAPPPWRRLLRSRPAMLGAGLFLVTGFCVNFIGGSGRGVFPTVQSRLNLGDAYRAQGRSDQAEKEYRAGLQILGDEEMSPATAAAMGVDPVRMRQEVESERMAQGVNFDAVRAGLHFGMGALWLDQGKELQPKDKGRGDDLVRRGVKEMELASKIVPYPAYLRRLAEGYSALGLVPEAERAYRGALAVAPDDFALHYDLAGLYYDGGRFREALAEIQEARRSARDLNAFELSDYHFGMGLVRLDGFSQRGQALYHFQQALAAYPGHREAAKIRELIEKLTSDGVTPEKED